MKRLAAIKAKHAEELAEAEQVEKILADLVGVPGVDTDSVSVCIHTFRAVPHASVALWAGFRTTRTLSDAVAVVQHFKDRILDSEHWKDGCISCRPAEINEHAKKESATLDGSHAVEIEVKGGRGYGPDVEVQFWVKFGGVLCELNCPVAGLWNLIPAVRGRYNQHGEFLGKIEWNPTETQTADSFRKFWSEPPSYHGSYYLADVPNFLAWASGHGWKG